MDVGKWWETLWLVGSLTWAICSLSDAHTTSLTCGLCYILISVRELSDSSQCHVVHSTPILIYLTFLLSLDFNNEFHFTYRQL